MFTFLTLALTSLTPLASPFRIDSRVLVAMEDGPVVIEVTLTYVGSEAICVEEVCYDSPCSASPPAEWGKWLVRRPRPVIFIGSTVRMIHPGEKLVRFVSPTAKLFCRPRQGDCSIEIRGHFAFAAPTAGSPRVLPIPRRVQAVTVKPRTATTESWLLKLIDDGVNHINSSNPEPHELLYQTRLLENIALGSQGEFSRIVAAHMLKAKTATAIRADLVRLAGYPAGISPQRRAAVFAYFASAHPQLVSTFVKSLAVGDRAVETRATRWWRARWYFRSSLETDQWAREPFDFTMQLLDFILPPPPLSDGNVRCFAEFAASQGPELAILFYAQFRSRLSAESTAQLKLAITSGTSAKSTATIARSLSQLDADDFEAREQASDTLVMSLSSSGVYDLIIAQQNRTDISPEVRYRLAAILRHPKATSTAALRAEVLAHIRTGSTPADLDVLKLLAGGNKEANLVKAAKARLQELQAKHDK